MPEVQVVDDEIPVTRGGGGGAARERSLSNRPAEDETVDLRGATTGRRRASGRVSEDEDVRDRPARAPKEAASLKALLDKHMPEVDEGDGGEDDPDAPQDDEVPVGDVGDGGEDDPDAPQDEDVVDAGEEPAEEQPDDRDERIASLTADYDRSIAVNRDLVAALEDAEKRARAPREPTAFEKRMLDAVAHYDDNPVLAVRHFLAACVEADKHDGDHVNRELSGLYIDLNAQELGVPLNETVKAQRDNAHLRNRLDRQKREEAAKAKKPETNDQAERDEGARRHIDQELRTKNAEGKSLADEFPLVMGLAQRLDGMPPAALLWEVMQRETKAGRFHAQMSGDDLLRNAAKFVETHYANFLTAADEARKKNQPTSTAKPNSKANAGTDKRQQTGARTISNADATRAPARPPAKAPLPNKTKRSLDDVLDKHFGVKIRKK